jgi:hypothetical protein
MPDIAGRPWLTNPQPGDVVETDGDFTCIGNKKRKHIQADKDGLYFTCNAGRHYLCGQLNDDGEYVGLYLIERK